jgi:hypothetical protein
MVFACLAWLLCSPVLPCLGQLTFSPVDRTPYDRQMSRVTTVLASFNDDAGVKLSLAKVNEWMTALRAIPYQYSREWKTPAEVQVEKVADCKGKALALYEKMRVNGEKNVRLIIGKRCAGSPLTHAWLEWETGDQSYILDPTFDSIATREMQDGWTYIPFYAYEGANKYQAILLPLAAQTLPARNLESPSQGSNVTSRSRSSRGPADESSDQAFAPTDDLSCRLLRRNHRLTRATRGPVLEDYMMQPARLEWQRTP